MHEDSTQLDEDSDQTLTTSGGERRALTFIGAVDSGGTVPVVCHTLLENGATIREVIITAIKVGDIVHTN